MSQLHFCDVSSTHWYPSDKALTSSRDLVTFVPRPHPPPVMDQLAVCETHTARDEMLEVCPGLCPGSAGNGAYSLLLLWE